MMYKRVPSSAVGEAGPAVTTLTLSVVVPAPSVAAGRGVQPSVDASGNQSDPPVPSSATGGNALVDTPSQAPAMPVPSSRSAHLTGMANSVRVPRACGELTAVKLSG